MMDGAAPRHDPAQGGGIDAAGWYLVQLRPGGLARALANLARQGFAVFAPRRLETRRRGGRLVTQECLLFPGYIFVGFDIETPAWAAIRSTYGVSRLVALDGRRPTRVPDGVMDALFAAEAGGLLAADLSHLKPGRTVSILAGPFAGAVARILAAPQDARVMVLMSMMGRDVAASVPVGAVI